MTEVWALPGYDVQALIGFGATAEVWRARELATGELVALKRLRDGVDLDAVESLRREASVLRSLDTPYVVRLRAVLGEGADTVLVLDLATGGSLAALLTRRGSLDPAEVVTVAAPLAQALAAAHACGLVHGNVTPRNILFTADGMPLLADLGLGRLDPAAAAEEPDAAADVRALAAVCHHMLSGTALHDDEADGALDDPRAPLALLAPAAPRALVSAVERGLQADPALRPDALAFASAVRRSHAAAPVRLAAAPPVESAAPAQRLPSPPATVPDAAVRGPRRTTLLAGAIGLALVAALLGWLSGRSGPVQLASVEAATPAASAPPGHVAIVSSWRSIVQSLDRARSDAFATGDAQALGSVYAAGSPLLRADRAAIGRLTAAGQRARGVQHRITSVDVASHSDSVVVLRVVDELPAYVIVNGSGQVVARSARRPAAPFVVRLVRAPAGWRLAEITPG